MGDLQGISACVCPFGGGCNFRVLGISTLASTGLSVFKRGRHMKKLIGLILLGGAGYLGYTNPDYATHKQVIAAQLPDQASYSQESEMERPIFGNLDYSNFLIGSATKDTAKLTLVSYGFLGKVKVVDKDWRPAAK